MDTIIGLFNCDCGVIMKNISIKRLLKCMMSVVRLSIEIIWKNVYLHDLNAYDPNIGNRGRHRVPHWSPVAGYLSSILARTPKRIYVIEMDCQRTLTA